MKVIAPETHKSISQQSGGDKKVTMNLMGINWVRAIGPWQRTCPAYRRSPAFPPSPKVDGGAKAVTRPWKAAVSLNWTDGVIL